MRIAILIDTLNSGGAQRQVVLLARELKSSGHDVAVCVYMPGRFYANEVRRAEVKLIELYPANRWQKFTMLYAWLRKWRPQILQAFLPMPSILAELTSLLPHTWKVVASERSVGPPPNFQSWLIRQLHRRADWIITNSHTNLDQLLLDVPSHRGKSSVIWNMVDLQHFSPPVNIRADDGIINFLSVATMRPVKNPLHLLKALHLLRQRQIYNFHLRWVGQVRHDDHKQVETYQEVVEYVRRYQLQDHFTFVGEKENVLQYYHTADALVLVSFFEGLSNVVCEAMACHLPLVLSHVSDHPLIAEEKRTAFLCSPHNPESIADALQSIIRLPRSVRHAMGESARKVAVSLFNHRRFIAEFERIYRYLLNDGKVRSSTKPSNPAFKAGKESLQ